MKEKASQNFFTRMATFIVDKRNLFFLLYLFAAVSSVASETGFPSLWMMTCEPGMSLACGQISSPRALCVIRSFWREFFATVMAVPSSA